ncbi:polyketide synthetase PksP [Metarhizium guizhouense ARSEF 977]|uniref:Polyketide synthetase PksP n=1 Tax=Metarhizium guizhouense (strain ARSEF 977) TaxID=1276136 RepID=A0A0B4GRM4_METGA|nr:polyketide synthetase PksP [Metarhizium guizhouense ARSEF 977]
MSPISPTEPFEPNAAQRAIVVSVTAEEVSLCVIAIAVTIVRVGARAVAVGWKGLRGDDYLVTVAALFYASMTAVSTSLNHFSGGETNAGLTDDERAAILPGSLAFEQRVLGSKLQIGGWLSYMMCLWTLKASLLVLYLRLTEGLGRHYTVRIYTGFGLLIASWIAVLANLFLACRPFYKNWQIHPDPGNVCQPTVSYPIVWVNLSLNVFTDFYLISIPVPLLWQSSMRAIKKVGLMVLFSGGLLVATCAILRSTMVFGKYTSRTGIACLWAAREVFVAVFATNLPIVAPRVVRWLAPVFGSILSLGSQKTDQVSNGFRTVGGGGRNKPSWRGRGPPTPNPITNLTSISTWTSTSTEVEMKDATDLHVVETSIKASPKG